MRRLAIPQDQDPGRADAAQGTQSPDAGVEPLAVISPLLGRHIAFHRRLVDLTGGVTSALLLSQSIYWTRHGRDIALSAGWFHKTAAQWLMETGLSAREQVGVRESLRSLALLEDQRMGIPARLHFRVNLHQLGMRLACARMGAAPVADWADRFAVAELLGPSVAFHRTLVSIGGGVHAGLMLSHALHLMRVQSRHRRDDWIGSSVARWFDEVGLTRREQEAARRDLIRIGLWEERVSGIPPNLSARIRLDGLLRLLATCSMPAKAARSPVAEPACGDAANKRAPKVETRMWEHRIHVLTKAPQLLRQNRHNCSDKSAELRVSNSTGVSVQLQLSSCDARDPGFAAGGGALIFPERMLPQECDAARALLRGSGEQAQVLLDELAGRLPAGGVRSTPVSYLRGLILRAATGSFVPELAPRIAAGRQQRQRTLDQRLEQETQEQRLEADRASPEYQRRLRAQREKVNKLRDELKQRIAKGGTP